MPVRLEQLVGEGGVLGGQRRAVVETRLGPEHEFEAVAVLGNGDAFGQQPVDRVRLIERERHQRIETHLHARRRIAARHEAVQRVEGLDVLIEEPVGRREIEKPALRRVGVDIVEMREIRRIFQVAEGREPVQLLARRAGREDFSGKQRRGEASSRAGEEVAAGGAHQFVFPYFAASAFSFSGSIHQDSVSGPA